MKILRVLLTMCCCIILCGCGSFANDSVSQNVIHAYVEEHQDILEALPYEDLDNSALDEQYAKSLLGEETIVKSIYIHNNHIVDFYCGGTGLTPSSTYSGFYYSGDDVPHGLMFGDCDFTETKPNVYEWKSENGRCTAYTERIVKGWYYYMLTYN